MHGEVRLCHGLSTAIAPHWLKSLSRQYINQNPVKIAAKCNANQELLDRLVPCVLKKGIKDDLPSTTLVHRLRAQCEVQRNM